MVHCIESNPETSGRFSTFPFATNSKFLNPFQVLVAKWAIIVYANCWSLDLVGIMLKYAFTWKCTGVVYEMNLGSLCIIGVLNEFLQYSFRRITF